MKHPFQPIGPLPSGSPLYIERGPEKEAVGLLCNDNPDFLLITEPRQQGKTSFINYLSVHPALSHCCFLSINAGRLVRETTESAWYTLFRDEAQRQLTLCGMPDLLLPACTSQEQWRDLMVMVGQEALRKQRLIVVTIDEMGHLSANWRASFLSAICEIRDSRANTPAFNAITFIFAGSFRPEAMITDWNISPFNKARPLALDDFTPEQIAKLFQRVGVAENLARVIVPQLDYWTDGQPYLVQRLCEIILAHAPSIVMREEIEAAVNVLERRDQVHLPPLFEKLRSSKRLYQRAERVLNGLDVEFAPASLKWQAELNSLGLIKEQKSTGRCIIRNPIYARAFRRMLLDQREENSTSADLFAEYKHLEALIAVKTERYRQLELDAARFGVYVPPHMSIELRELGKEIAGLREQLQVMENHSDN